MIKITVPSRLHITLLDLGSNGYRRNGGIGFCINAPSVELHFSSFETVDLSKLRDVGFDQFEIDTLASTTQENQIVLGVKSGLIITEAKIYGRHVGVGVGTAIALAIVEALAILNSRSLNPMEIIRLSGRGGTSGIGVNSYFTGGFIFDAGRKFDLRPFLSSDDIRSAPSAPLVVSRMPMPNWQIGLFTPKQAHPITVEQERALFKTKLPLLPEEVYEAVYHSIFGVLVSIAEEDYDSFCRAINKIQNCAWKKHEIDLHAERMHAYLNGLKELGCDAVGMSSIGPTLFFLAKNDGIFNLIKETYPECQVEIVSVDNFGRQIEYA